MTTKETPVKISDQDLKFINDTLKELFGVDTVTGDQIWRVTWVNDEYETRKVDYTVEGLRLPHAEIQYLPKYMYLINRYILEQLVLVPECDKEELLGRQISYEGIFTFEKADGSYLPPRVDVAKFVIDTLNAVKGRTQGLRDYVKPGSEKDLAERKAALNQMYEDLFGDETKVTDALAYGSGITVPDMNKVH